MKSSLKLNFTTELVYFIAFKWRSVTSITRYITLFQTIEGIRVISYHNLMQSFCKKELEFFMFKWWELKGAVFIVHSFIV